MNGKSSPVEQRRERQAQALRENLKRRKAQARGRSQMAPEPSAAPEEDLANHAPGTGLSPQSDGD